MVHLSCGVRCTRITLLVLNILFFAFGIALLGFGIYLVASRKFDIALSDHISTQIIGGEAMEAVGIVLIVVGIFTGVLSAFGFLGAFYQHRILLYSYALILIILMILELAAFITTMSFRVRIRNNYESGLSKVFNDAYENERQDLIEAIKELEREFKCCGVNSSKDYEKINITIPPECYENQQPSESLFETGCADAFIDWIWDGLPIIGGIIGAIICFEIFGVISSVSLAVAISHYSYGKINAEFKMH